ATTAGVFARWAVAHARLLETVRSVPDDADKLAFDVVEWNTTGHYPDHYADIGAAMRSSADLLGVVQTPWVAFRLAIGAIGRPGLEEKTSTGWTYKDLVAHAAAWEDRTAERLRQFRSGRPSCLRSCARAGVRSGALRTDWVWTRCRTRRRPAGRTRRCSATSPTGWGTLPKSCRTASRDGAARSWTSMLKTRVRPRRVRRGPPTKSGSGFTRHIRVPSIW